jgi:membrane protease YdiL (CAAX protease family)
VHVLWRVAIFLAMCAAVVVLAIVLVAEPLTALHRRGLFLASLDKEPYDRVINMIIGPLMAIGMVMCVKIAAQRLDRRPLSDYGVILDAAWWKSLVLGFAIAAAVMLLVFAGEAAAGLVVITSFGAASLFSIVKVLCVGVYEEFVARGYLLRNIGVIPSSLIFALLHLTNDNASVLSTLGIFVNALFFAAAAILTRRLSAAIGAHIAWNLFEGAILGFPVSGDKEISSLIEIRQLGHPLMTGGEFGPEAGLVGILASLLGIALLYGVVRASGAPLGAVPEARTTPIH